MGPRKTMTGAIGSLSVAMCGTSSAADPLRVLLCGSFLSWRSLSSYLPYSLQQQSCVLPEPVEQMLVSFSEIFRGQSRHPISIDVPKHEQSMTDFFRDQIARPLGPVIISISVWFRTTPCYSSLRLHRFVFETMLQRMD